MRTRVRTTSTTLPAGQEIRNWIAGPGSPKTEYVNKPVYTYTSLQETCTDELALKQRTGYCLHSKVSTWYADSLSMGFLWSSGGITYNSVCTGSMLYHYVVAERGTSTIRNLSPVVTSNGFDWGNASYHALSQMRESIYDGFLGPNFIRELAELGVDLRNAVKNRQERAERERQKRLRFDRKREIASRNENYRRKWEQSLMQSLAPESPLWKRTVGALARAVNAAAWANLAYQFVVRPTISDAKKLASTIGRLQDLVAQLIRKAGTRQKRYYKRPVDNLLALPSDVTSNNTVLFGAVNTSTRRCAWLTRPTYRASMLFTYDATLLKGFLGRLTSLINAFGVNRPASIIWEAVPFSFVVDWFVNVGDVIRSVEDQLIDPLPIVIHDFSHSLKYSWRAKYEWNWKSGAVITDLAFKDFHVYERRRDTPSLVDSLSVRLPNLNQTGLGLSLLILRMDGKTKWKRR